MRFRPGHFVPPDWMFIGVSLGPGRVLRRRIESIAAARPPRRRWSMLGLLLVLLVGCAALTDKRQPQDPLPPAAERSSEAPPDAGSAEATAAELARDRLRTPISLNFNDEPLTEVLYHLNNKLDVPIVPNWRLLEAEGIDPQMRITANIPSIPGDSALEVILDRAGGDETPLGYDIDKHGRVVIAPADHLMALLAVIKTYDIRDLLIIPPAFDEPDIDGQPQARAAEPPEPQITREKLVRQVSNLIRNTIAPDHWREAGGEVGSLSELNGTLIINTTEANHAAIAQLLGQIRATRALQYNVRATFVLVGDRVYDELVRPLLKPRDEGDAAQTAFLDEQQAEQLLAAVKRDPQSLRIAAPSITAFNGQRTYITTGHETAYVADYERDARTGKLEPERRNLWEGAMLDLQGTVSADRKALTMSVDATVQKVTKLAEVAHPQSPADQPAIFHSPQITRTQLRTTASVPAGQTLVLTGGTMQGNPLDRDSKDRRERWVVVLIKPTILDPKEASK